MDYPPIVGYIPASTNEWDGRVSATIFLPGCNFTCAYCHASYFLSNPTETIPLQRLLNHLEENQGWVDGVVISGGEPTLHDDLPSLIREIKSYKVGVKLHSNGTRPDMIRYLLQSDLLNCLALDFKGPFADYVKITSFEDISLVQETFSLITSSSLEREYHTTVCPAFLNKQKLIEMAGTLNPKGIWYLQRYNPGDVLNPEEAGTESYDLDTLKEWVIELEKIRPEIRVVGRR